MTEQKYINNSEEYREFKKIFVEYIRNNDKGVTGVTDIINSLVDDEEKKLANEVLDDVMKTIKYGKKIVIKCMYIFLFTYQIQNEFLPDLMKCVSDDATFKNFLDKKILFLNPTKKKEHETEFLDVILRFVNAKIRTYNDCRNDLIKLLGDFDPTDIRLFNSDYTKNKEDREKAIKIFTKVKSKLKDDSGIDSSINKTIDSNLKSFIKLYAYELDGNTLTEQKKTHEDILSPTTTPPLKSKSKDIVSAPLPKPQLKSKSKDIVSAPPPKPQLKSKSKDIVSAPPPTPKPAITESKLSHKDQLTCDKPKLPKKKEDQFNLFLDQYSKYDLNLLTFDCESIRDDNLRNYCYNLNSIFNNHLLYSGVKVENKSNMIKKYLEDQNSIYNVLDFYQNECNHEDKSKKFEKLLSNFSNDELLLILKFAKIENNPTSISEELLNKTSGLIDRLLKIIDKKESIAEIVSLVIGYRCFRQMSLFDLKSYDEIREMIKTQFKIDSDSDLGLLYLSLYQYRSLLHNTNNIGITGLSIGDINDVSSVSSKICEFTYTGYEEDPDYNTIIISCSLFAMKSTEEYRGFKEYLNGLQNILKYINSEEYEFAGNALIYLYCDQKLNEMESFVKFKNECIKNKSPIKFISYKCNQFIQDDYHLGLFGTLMRFYPLFDIDLKYKTVIISDLEVGINYMRLLYQQIPIKMEENMVDVVYNVKIGYEYKYVNYFYNDLIDGTAIANIIANGTFKRPPVNLFNKWMINVLKYDEIKKIMIEMTSKKNTSEVQWIGSKFSYGIDELFINRVYIPLINSNSAIKQGIYYYSDNLSTYPDDMIDYENTEIDNIVLYYETIFRKKKPHNLDCRDFISECKSKLKYEFGLVNHVNNNEKYRDMVFHFIKTTIDMIIEGKLKYTDIRWVENLAKHDMYSPSVMFISDTNVEEFIYEHLQKNSKKHNNRRMANELAIKYSQYYLLNVNIRSLPKRNPLSYSIGSDDYFCLFKPIIKCDGFSTNNSGFSLVMTNSMSDLQIKYWSIFISLNYINNDMFPTKCSKYDQTSICIESQYSRYPTKVCHMIENVDTSILSFNPPNKWNYLKDEQSQYYDNEFMPLLKSLVDMLCDMESSGYLITRLYQIHLIYTNNKLLPIFWDLRPRLQIELDPILLQKFGLDFSTKITSWYEIKKTYDPSVNLELGRPIKNDTVEFDMYDISKISEWTYDMFYDKDLIDEINQWLNNPYCELIDKSVLGKIFSFYPINDINCVIRQENYKPNLKISIPNYNKIYKLIDTISIDSTIANNQNESAVSDTMLVNWEIPNFINGIIVHQLLSTKYPHVFPKFIAGTFDIHSKKKTSYIIMEKLNHISNYVKDSKTFLEFLLLLLNNLELVQKTTSDGYGEFYHNDLRIENIMYRDVKNIKIKIDINENKKISFDSDKELVFVDLSTSTYKTPYGVFNNIVEEHQHPFDEWKDIFFLINKIMNNIKFPKASTTVKIMDIRTIMSSLFDKNIIDNYVQNKNYKLLPSIIEQLKKNTMQIYPKISDLKNEIAVRLTRDYSSIYNMS